MSGHPWTNVVAVDPGGTTGLAQAAFYPDGRIVEDSFRSWERDPFRAMREVEGMLEGRVLDAVVCERYTITPQTLKKSAQYDALYQVGILGYLARRYGVKVTLQQPSQAKRLATNDKLERIGWRRPSPGGHQDDASRHLLTYALSQRLMPLEVFT
jgi:hypothetical protein